MSLISDVTVLKPADDPAGKVPVASRGAASVPLLDAEQQQPEADIAEKVSTGGADETMETSFLYGPTMRVRIHRGLREASKSVTAMQYCMDELEACQLLALSHPPKNTGAYRPGLPAASESLLQATAGESS